MAEEEKIKDRFSDTLVWVGIITAVPAVVSFIQHTLKVGLAPQIADVVAYYRSLLYPLFSYVDRYLVFIHLHLTIPDWYKDLFPVAVVGASITIRSFFITFRTIQRRVSFNHVITQVMIFVSMCIFLWGSIAPFFLIVLHYVSRYNENGNFEARQYQYYAGRVCLKSVIGTIGGTIIVYFVNHVMKTTA